MPIKYSTNEFLIFQREIFLLHSMTQRISATSRCIENIFPASRILICLLIKLMKEAQRGCWCMFSKILQYCQWQFEIVRLWHQVRVLRIQLNCNIVKEMKETQQISTIQCIFKTNIALKLLLKPSSSFQNGKLIVVSINFWMKIIL